MADSMSRTTTKFTTRGAALIAVVLLAGCAGQRTPAPPPGQPPPPMINKPRPTPNAPFPSRSMNVPPRTAAQASSPAVMSLLKAADTQAKAGHREQAAAALERALDLSPRNPFIYQRLAAVRLSQGQVGQAEQLARKSNSVAGDNPFVKAGNWQLIARARRSTGDAQGARAADARAASYRTASSQYRQ
jgi:predicted Zn-dependent protease